MARLVRGRRIIDDSSDEDFPDIRQIGSFQTKDSKNARPTPVKQAEDLTSKGVVRRRKLGPISDNAVLRPVMARGTSRTIFDDDDTGQEKLTKPRRIELQARKAKPVGTRHEIQVSSDAESIQEETIIEDFSCDNESDFEASQNSDSEGDYPPAGLFLKQSPPKSSRRPRVGSSARREAHADRWSPSPSSQLLAEASEAQERGGAQESSSVRDIKSRYRPLSENAYGPRSTTPIDFAGPFTKLKA